MTTDPDTPAIATPSTPSAKTSSSKVVRSSRAEALLGSAPEEQIAAALAEQKWARAADLIAQFGERVLLDSGTREIAAWFDTLPDAEVSKNPRVAAISAWVRIYEQRYQDARHRLSQAERALKQLELAELNTQRAESDDADDHVELVPHADLKQSLAALHLHLQAVSEGGRVPTDVSEIMIPASTDHPLWRAGALLILGRCHFLAGHYAAAKDGLETAQVLASTTRGKRASRTAADATVLLGRVAESRLDLSVADASYKDVIARAANADDILAAHAATAEVGRASVALGRLELDTARTSLARVRAYVDGAADTHVDLIRIVFEGGLVEAWVLAMSGDFDAARVALDAVEKSLSNHQIRWPLELLGAERAKLALLRRDDSTAKRWYQQHGMRAGVAARRPTRPSEAVTSLVSAHVLLSQHQPADAIPHLKAVLAYSEEANSRRPAIEALVLLTLAHFAAGDAGGKDASRASLVAALEAAEPERYALPFAVRGLDAVASEVGVSHPLLTRAASSLPAVVATPRERPQQKRVAVATGLIETAQVAASDASAAIEDTPDDVEISPVDAPSPDADLTSDKEGVQ